MKGIPGNFKLHPAVLVTLLLLTVGTAWLNAAGFSMLPLMLAGGFAGLIIVYYCLVKPLFAYYIVLILSFITAYPERILKTQIPITTGIEVLMLLLFIGTYSVKTGLANQQFYKKPVSIALLLYALYCFIELFNPEMTSVGGWLFFMRRFFMFVLIYVVSYRLFDNMDKIRYFFRAWVLLSVAAAVYACFQQWFGLLPFEMAYLRDNPHEYKLYFQGGTIRKFSFLSDPTTFGILAGSSAVFVLIRAINEQVRLKKRILFFMFFILMLGMTYSGTRTANIMLPAAIALYAMMTISNRTTLITVFVFISAALFILFGPIQGSNINRIRSTFESKEESANVRDENRKSIQPYIYSHPIGGGIATSGVQGEKYNPRHKLAGFPPDSGLLLAAIELGWIGYALTLFVYFLILYQGIHFYFITHKRENRIYIIAVLISVFTIIVTQYSQVTIGQLPTALFFYAGLALISRLKELGAAENPEIH